MPNLESLLSDAERAYTRGNLDAAAKAVAQALEVEPSNVEANVLMGVVWARKGNKLAAIGHLKRALEVNDESYEAHIALSTLLFADSQSDLALYHGNRAIALRPKDPASYHHLARGLIAHQRTVDAIPYLRQALTLAPGNPSLIQDLAAGLADIGEREEAIQFWTLLTKLHPAKVIGWIKLGGLYLASMQFKEAFVCGRRAIQIAPESPDARLLIGLALLGGDGGAFEAESHLNRVVQLKPDGFVGHSAYGLALQEMGRFDEARPHFEKAIENCPSHGQAYYSLINTRKTTEQDRPLLANLRRHIDDPAASSLDRSYMHYALGKALEDFGEYEDSMRHFDDATSLAAMTWFANRPPDRNRYSGMIQGVIETITPEFLTSQKRETLKSYKPLLVVGMIRSGTTLVEQILSSHPEAKGAGELPFWQEESPKFWDIAARKVDEAGLNDAARRYLALLDRLGADQARVIDKLPHNYTTIGFILATFPNAKVIYVKRHPIDNCLSIYTTAYQHPPEFTLTRSNIVFAYREQERVMRHWRSILPDRQFMEVNYEELVENREEITRRMIDFTGLEWNDACLHHESNARSVNTPSVWQVRQPIYKTSVARWRKFEPWLGEFRDLMPND